MRLRRGASKTGSADLSISKPSDEIACDICIIGAGAGGLSVAAAAAAFGVSVVLVEKRKMGGDCLNYGCVPSKALLAAAKTAQTMRKAGSFGIQPVEPVIDFAAVNDHVKSAIAAIAPNDSIERFSGMGVRVIQAAGRFVDRGTVIAGERRIKARRFVIATGSVPAVPSIPGLDDISYFTNETIFENRAPLAHLIVIGGGPIGMEMAQAHVRLGCRVTVIEGESALGRDDPELTRVVLQSVRSEGVDVREHTKIERVRAETGRVDVMISSVSGEETISGSHLLVATGRKPNIEGLGLDAAGVKCEVRGISVDVGMTTTNPKIFAIGDCTGGLQFTHVANYHAGIVIRRALFRIPAKFDTRIVPRVTYTDPELAHVGLSEDEARKEGAINVVRWPLHENDRAHVERRTDGLIKVITDKKGVILGVSIAGAEAGELIQTWSLAIARKMKIKAMTEWIVPYPTLGEISKRAAIRYFARVPGNTLVRKSIKLLAKLG